MKLTAGLAQTLVAITLVLTSCDDHNPPIAPCPQLETKQAPKPHLKKISFFLETSGSMKGYMPIGAQGTEFQSVVPDIIGRLGSNSSFTLNYYTIPETSRRPVQEDHQSAANQIASGQFPNSWGSYTSIPAMLDTINHYQGKDDVTILVSDLIYSPTDLSDLRKAITDIRNGLANKVSAVSLLAVTSKFKQNNVLVDAPYYMLIQGAQENVKLVKEKIAQSFSLFKTKYEELNVGFEYKQPYYSILPFSNFYENGTAETCDQTSSRYVIINGVNRNDSLKFWIGINLEDVPNYYKNISFLKSNLIIENDRAKIASILDQNTFRRSVMHKDDRQIVDSCTHFILLEVTDKNAGDTDLNINLKTVNPPWIEVFSHDTIQLAEKERQKTFGLKNIYLAMQDAYSDNKIKSLFSKPIQILFKTN